MVRKIEHDDGTIVYRNENGKIHRDDGPAVILLNGDQHWYRNGKKHRDDGPAIVYSSGEVFWCLNGEFHREDGPAVIYPSGIVSWWLNNRSYSFEEWIEQTNITKEEKIEIYLKFA